MDWNGWIGVKNLYKIEQLSETCAMYSPPKVYILRAQCPSWDRTIRYVQSTTWPTQIIEFRCTRKKMTSFDRDRRERRARAPRHSAAGSLFWLPFEGHFDFDFIVFFTDHLFETVDQPWRSNTRSNEILSTTHSLTDTIHDTCSDVIAQNFTTSTDRWTCGRLRIYEKMRNWVRIPQKI